MRINFATVWGRVYTVEGIDPYVTIGHLGEVCSAVTNIPVDQFRMVYARYPMDDDNLLLVTYGVQEGDRILVVMRTRGGVRGDVVGVPRTPGYDEGYPYPPWRSVQGGPNCRHAGAA